MPSVHIQALDDPRVIERLRVLDDYCFPVKYQDSYYSNVGKKNKGDAVRDWSPLNNIAFYQDMLIGSITTRLEQLMSDDNEGKDAVPGKKRAYIMTLGVLEPYRRMGVASSLVRRVIEYAATLADVDEVGLNVQQGSTALKFYEKLGFTIRYEHKNYYTDIEPTLDAFYVSIKLEPFRQQAASAQSKKK